MSARGPAIIVMVKAPRPGTVKTRLTPALSPDDAAGLATAFAQDAVANAQPIALVLVAYAPTDGRALLESLLPAGLLWTPQRGDGLGARMRQAMADAETLGFGPLIVIGTDSPTLPPNFLAQAISRLQSDEADVTLGPTDDGGYYLVGTQRPMPGLFDGVAWSTPSAFAQTWDNAGRLGLRLLALPPWYDIDAPDDLDRLRRELAADAAQRRCAPATTAWCAARPGFTPDPPGAAHR